MTPLFCTLRIGNLCNMFCFNKIILILVSVFMFASCNSEQTFTESKDIPEKGWNRYDTLFFSPKIEEAGRYNLFIDSRNNNHYSYQNLWLFVFCKQDSAIMFSDTVQTTLADKLGNWLGAGWGSLYELSTPIKNNIVLTPGQKYTFKVVQGMRDYDLAGIASVGFRLEKAK